MTIHPYMHRTDSVDYSIVLQGEVTMLMDEEDIDLKAGDVIIQQGTNHARANPRHRTLHHHVRAQRRGEGLSSSRRWVLW